MAEIATGNREDALDIVQEAMMGLVKKYASRSEADWPPLFYRILQNRIRDWYRRNTVRNRWRLFFKKTDGADDPIEAMPDNHQKTPEQNLLLSNAGTSLVTALHNLPNRQQQAFLLRAWEGMNVKETAIAMSCSQGSVKTHYSRAVNTLREKLEDHKP